LSLVAIEGDVEVALEEILSPSVIKPMTTGVNGGKPFASRL